MEMYKVTVPWNPNNDEEGIYSNYVKANSDIEATLAVVQEMAESRKFDSQEEKLEWINDLAQSGFVDVFSISAELRNGLQIMYGEFLFPNGVQLGLDLEALGKVLAENRDRLLIKPAPTMRAGG